MHLLALLLALQRSTAGARGAALAKVSVGFAQVVHAFFSEEDGSPVAGGALLSFDPLELRGARLGPDKAVLPLVQFFYRARAV